MPQPQPANSTSPWIPTIVGLAGGGLAGSALAMLTNYLRERHQSKSCQGAYWSALDAEVELCAGLARVYVAPNAPPSPLYRLPTIGYHAVFPALLSDGAISSREDVSSVIRFYSQVEQINRGLDDVHQAVIDEGILQEPITTSLVYERQVNRVVKKAQDLVDDACPDPDGPYYKRVRKLIDDHLAKSTRRPSDVPTGSQGENTGS